MIVAILGFTWIITICTDYIALLKTRMLLSLSTQAMPRLPASMLVMTDAILSVAVSFICTLAIVLVSDWHSPVLPMMLVYFYEMMNDLSAVFSSNGEIPGFGIMFLSTLMTSAWTFLILLSTTVLKLLAPLQHFTAWFFDVERHPVQAIGTVAGTLLMVMALFWSVVRSLISP
jgi:hypothetical protein